MVWLANDVDRWLEREFAGQILRHGDARYEQARRMFNKLIDRRPALMARCTGTADLIAAVNHAREHRLRVSVYGGGHSFAGHSVCDDGLVIDLRPMNGVQVDPERRVATVQAGVTWGELDRETQAFGLAVTGGRDSTTGIAGLTLGGGSGWLERSIGRSADNLLSAEVVTADGAALTASATEHPELFWGLRGGGGNFEVVTRFTFALHPLGPTVLGGPLVYPHPHAGQVLRFFREFFAAAPDQVAGAATLATAPDAPLVPEPLRARPVLTIVACYLGPTADGEAALRALREFGPPVLDRVAPVPYTGLQRLAEPPASNGDRFYSSFGYVPELSDQAIDTLVAGTAQPSGTIAVLVPFGGALARRPDEATAAGHRREPFGLNLVTQWADPHQDEHHIGAARALAAAMSPFTIAGAAYATSDDGAQPDRVQAEFGPVAYRRLQALKDRYDPENLFRLNHNIPPSERRP